MRQRERQRVLGRYRRAVKAYGELVEQLEKAIPPAAARTQRRLKVALDQLLPVLGECIADLPGVVSDLSEKVEVLRLLQRQAEEAGLHFRYDDGEELSFGESGAD